MNRVPQIELITTLHHNYEALFGRLDQGPVILIQEGRSAAVLVSVTAWDRWAKRLAYLERVVAGDYATMKGDFVDAQEIDATFEKMEIRKSV